jgi:hypothetical protein
MDPTKIARIICDINKAQYHQAHCTPFGSGSLASLIGRRGNTATAKTLISGLLPHRVLDHLLPETVRILHTLVTPAPTFMQATTEITPDTFISTYKNIREDTSPHHRADTLVTTRWLVKIRCSHFYMPP